jgi:hypothetical protein
MIGGQVARVQGASCLLLELAEVRELKGRDGDCAVLDLLLREPGEALGVAKKVSVSVPQAIWTVATSMLRGSLGMGHPFSR